MQNIFELFFRLNIVNEMNKRDSFKNQNISIPIFSDSLLLFANQRFEKCFVLY